MGKDRPFLAQVYRYLDTRRAVWLLPLMLIALLAIGVLLFGDQPPMAAIFYVVL